MQTIAKSIREKGQANLKLYEKDYAAFSWNQAELCMTELPGNRGLNMAFEAVDRHVDVFRPQVRSCQYESHGSETSKRYP